MAENEQANTDTDNGAGQNEPDPNITVPQDTNPSPFKQGFPEQGGGEQYDELRDGETLAAFAFRHGIPVNVVREANADSIDANGTILANTTRLVVPQ